MGSTSTSHRYRYRCRCRGDSIHSVEALYGSKQEPSLCRSIKIPRGMRLLIDLATKAKQVNKIPPRVFSQALIRQFSMGSSGSDAMAEVQRLISTEPLVVFSKTYCSFSIRAKQLLKMLNAPFTAVELNTVNDGSGMQAALRELTGRRTVPNIFLEGNALGGCDELMHLNATGELTKLLQKANI